MLARDVQEKLQSARFGRSLVVLASTESTNDDVRRAALEGAPHGVTSNCVNPAYVRTPLVEKQLADQARAHDLPFDLSHRVVEAYRAALVRFGAVDGELLASRLLEERAGWTLRGDPA